MKNFYKGYRDKDRGLDCGPMRIGNYLELREDIYSVAYLYQMRRVWTEGLPSEDEL